MGIGTEGGVPMIKQALFWCSGGGMRDLNGGGVVEKWRSHAHGRL